MLFKSKPASAATIAAALTGHYRPEYVFILRQNLALYEMCHEQVAGCDAAVERLLVDLAAQAAPAPAPPTMPAGAGPVTDERPAP